MHSFWTPVRMITGIALLAPVSNVGLSLLQLLVLLAFGTVDTITTKYLSDPFYDYLKDRGGVLAPVSTAHTKQIASETAEAFLRAMVIQSYAIQNVDSKEKMGGNVTTKNNTMVVSFTAPTGVPDYNMGGIVMPCSADYGISCNSLTSAFGTLASDIQPIAVSLAGPDGGYGQQQRYIDAMNRFETSLASSIATFASNGTNGYKDAYDKFIDNAKASGWSGLGMFYWTFSGFQNRLQDIVANTKPSINYPTGFALLGLDNRYYAHAKAAREFADTANTVRDSTGSAMMQSAASYDEISLTWYDKAFRAAYNVAKPVANSIENVAGGIPVVGGAIGGAAQLGAETIGGKAGYSMIGPKGVQMMLGSGDPIASMSGWGHTMVALTSVAATSMAAKKVLTDANAAGAESKDSDEGTGAQTDFASGKNSKAAKESNARLKAGAASLMGIAKDIGMAAMGPIFLGSWMLAYYLPAVPFTLWVIGLVSMVLLLLVSLAAAPFVALSQAIPSAEHGMFGPARSSYLLLMTIFLRPPLMVIGFAMSVILMTGAGRMVAFAFQTYYAGAEADYVSGMLSGMSMVFLVGGLMLVIAHILFALPNSITESVTRYIGQGQPTLGDETSDVRAKGNVAATTGVMTRALGGASRRLGMDPHTRGTKSRAQDHMQVDNVRQGDRGEGKDATKMNFLD